MADRESELAMIGCRENGQPPGWMTVKNGLLYCGLLTLVSRSTPTKRTRCRERVERTCFLACTYDNAINFSFQPLL